MDYSFNNVLYLHHPFYKMYLLVIYSNIDYQLHLMQYNQYKHNKQVIMDMFLHIHQLHKFNIKFYYIMVCINNLLNLSTRLHRQSMDMQIDINIDKGKSSINRINNIRHYFNMQYRLQNMVNTMHYQHPTNNQHYNQSHKRHLTNMFEYY